MRGKLFRLKETVQSNIEGSLGAAFFYVVLGEVQSQSSYRLWSMDYQSKFYFSPNLNCIQSLPLPTTKKHPNNGRANQKRPS
jgi:hypothetical protein